MIISENLKKEVLLVTKQRLALNVLTKSGFCSMLMFNSDQETEDAYSELEKAINPVKDEKTNKQEDKS